MIGTPLPRQRTGLDVQAKVARLRQSGAYPERPVRVKVVETHMSWVFFTEHHAYKLKKPVRYEFLDFSTLAARRRNCMEELRLNQRLARGVYLDVVPLTLDDAGMTRVEGPGEVVDWLVKMRRLPAGRMLDHMIRYQTVREEDVRRAAALLAGFYRESPAVMLDGAEYHARVAKQARAGLRELSNPVYDLPAERVQTVYAAQSRWLAQEAELLVQRARAGRVIEGHGDLRPEHVCLGPEPVIFDRLEFNRDFRLLDAADELAFLAMECERLGAPFVGRMLFDTYLAMTGDAPPKRLVSFYKTYRACLRAKLAIWHVRELPPAQWTKWRDLAGAYLRLAEHYTRALA